MEHFILSLHRHLGKIAIILGTAVIINMPMITYAAKCVDGTCGS